MKLPADVVEDVSIVPPPGVDTSPLAPDLLVRIQSFSLGDSTRGNWRAEVHADGKLYVQHNARAPDPVAPARYGAPLPQTPTEVLEAKTMDRVRELIRHDVLALAVGYRSSHGVDDGSGRMVDVQLDGRSHRTTLLNARLPAITELEDFVRRYP